MRRFLCCFFYDKRQGEAAAERRNRAVSGSIPSKAWAQSEEFLLGRNRKILGLELSYDEDNGLSIWINN